MKVPIRLQLAGLAAIGFVNLYMVRVNVSVILVAMTQSSTRHLLNHSYSSLSNESSENWLTEASVNTSDTEVGEFDWDSDVKGFILAGFFYGYAGTQIIGGRLAEVYGPCRLFGISILLGGILTMAAPLAVKLHFGVFIASRIALGLIHGVTWPASFALITRWFPPLERARFIGYVNLSTCIGTIITFPLCGIVISNHGWEAAFYVTAVLSIVWSILWFFLVCDYPKDHPRISPEELDYIQKHILEGGTSRLVARPVPWKSVCLSSPFMALMVFEVANSWGLTFLLTETPVYLKEVLGFSLKSSAWLAALPFLCRYLGSITSSTSADCLVSRNLVSLHNVRRTFSIIAMFGPAVAFLGAANTGYNPTLNVAFLSLGLLLNGSVTASYMPNFTDIASNYSGTLMGIDNTLFSIVSLSVPSIVSLVVGHEGTMEEWQAVFYVSVALYTVCEIFYLSFFSTSVQSWNFYADVVSEHCTEARKLQEGNNESSQF